MRRISILGSTGSVGTQTIDLITRAGAGTFGVVALTGASNITLLAQQARALQPEIAVTSDPAKLADLRAALAGSGIAAAAGPEAIREAAARPADIAVNAIIGAAGLVPGLTALQSGAVLALANKESLVAAGKRLRDRNLAPHRLTEAERAGAYGYFHDDLLRTQALTGLDLSASAAQSVVLMFLVIILTVVQFRYVERKVRYQ